LTKRLNNMTQTYNLQAVRRLLTAAFSADEIAALALDLFYPVYDDFASGMSKGDRVLRIVDYAARHGRIPDLLAYVEKQNPRQYGRFAPELAPIPLAEPPGRQADAAPAWQQRRLADIQDHLQREYDLLKAYEAQLQTEDDPRRLLRIQREIERQREAIGRYQREMGELTAVAAAQSPTAVRQVEESFATINQKLDALSQQMADGHAAIRDDLAVQRQAIVDRVDLRYAQTIQRVADQLDGQQLQMIALLQTAVNQQQLAQTEAQTVNQQTQAALLALRQAQPDAAQWQTMLDLLEQAAGWEQKVKLALPLIPGLLSFESEIKLDALPPLNQTWRRLVAQFR
jgi:hypothetical protein